MSSTLLNKKIDYWEHQLLDLGKRNKMINYRETKRSTLKLLEPGFDELYQRLAENEETLTFQRPIDRETDVRVFSILSLLEHLSSPLPVNIGDIRTESSLLERQKTLNNMRSKARLAREEQGTNILYLSFGFIEWKDGTGSSAQWLKSPLLLVPAVLTLESLHSPYTLSRHEDDIVLNPTLTYYLKSEYGIDLPPFDPDKQNASDYLLSLEPIADQHGWRIVKEVSLGLLSFLKITMYNDLMQNEERIKQNPVIRAMSGDLADVNAIPEDLRTFDLDSVKTQDCYQVLSADSSQQDAILYSKNNISFVMQGPPGTGKSQTITNIIAEALADGKKVLFVSEKQAALQVVYRRLQDAHLGDFCLPLHSYKANKKEILEQIGANLSLKQTQVKDTALQSLEELSSIRQELNQYAAELHQLNPQLNFSCYEIYSKLEELKNVFSVSFLLENPLDVTPGQLQTFLNQLQEYTLALERIQYQVRNNPWEGFRTRVADHEYTDQMRQELEVLQHRITSALAFMKELTECPDLASTLPLSSMPQISSFLQQIRELPALPSHWIQEESLSSLQAAAQEARTLYETYQSAESYILDRFHSAIFQYDYAQWKEQLLSIAAGYKDLPYIPNADPVFYIENADALQSSIQQLQTALTHVQTAWTSVNGLLGINLPLHAQNLQSVHTLFSILQSGVVIPQSWFYADLVWLKATASEAQTRCQKLQELRSRLLANWDASILTLDFTPIFLRYKSDYTGTFKIFNAQYHADRRLLRQLSRVPLKKFPDSLAMELLMTLKDYRDLTIWFEMKQAELTGILGSYYQGPESHWDWILMALNTTEQLKSLPKECLSSHVISLLTTDHTTITTSLHPLMNACTAAWIEARNSLYSGSLYWNLNLDAPDFQLQDIFRNLTAYQRLFRQMDAHLALLTPYLLNSSLKLPEVYHFINELQRCQQLDAVLTSKDAWFRKHFDFLYDGRHTDWAAILQYLEQLQILQPLPLYSELKYLIPIAAERKQTLYQHSQPVLEMYHASHSSLQWLQSQFTTSVLSDTMTPSDAAVSLQNYIENLPMLSGWVDYQEARDLCLSGPLADFIEKIEEGSLFNDISQMFLKGFYYMWLGAVCDCLPSVRRFRRNKQDEQVERFTELDDMQLLIAQMRIREKLIRHLPSEHRLLKATDEVAILNKELGKKRNIMPLRKLFRQIPNLLLTLKPCLMMSPLSVSYFLETEAYHFDLVIFDEASQIFPEDAIGAIFRGSQVIIAGDSKQLPPTNFFSAATGNTDSLYDKDAEDDYADVVSDSILEESASVLPNRTLLWHYRSKDESLIAFSNREIYQNKLITFPNHTLNAPDMGVEYIYVDDGVYEGGGKNCNLREAQRCVELVKEHIDRYPNRSLGIIAFSEKQQAAIENAIIDFRERMPLYEEFFSEDREEPFFVKNLENVQGDERDTIIFSICYAKDQNGRMYMRFGPLGQEGGERRLNVAITRAKQNIKLVGSILPSDIDLKRTQAEGVRMLRSYIEFARNGNSALKPVDTANTLQTDDAFCQLIASFLESNGFSVQQHVGCSDYKIDIAVESPLNPGTFIAGIECDGYSYVQARTARDRDHLRCSVLQKMGWNLYRVWSTEWIRNPKAEGDALLQFLACAAAGTADSDISDPDISVDVIAIEAYNPSVSVPDQNPYQFAYYEEADWTQTPFSDPNDNNQQICDMIRYVVSVEQPLHMEQLYKRLGPAFTTGKATDAVKYTIDTVITQSLQDQVLIDSEQFIWMLPKIPPVVRIPSSDQSPRPMESIHTEEAAAAMLTIIQHSFGLTTEDLASECARVYGYERKGPKIRAKMDAALQYLVDTKQVRIIDDKVSLVKGSAL